MVSLIDCTLGDKLKLNTKHWIPCTTSLPAHHGRQTGNEIEIVTYMYNYCLQII